MGAVGARGTGHVRAPGAEAGVGAGDRGVGTRAFVTATVVTRLCARLRSVLRWLTRRLEVPERAVGRGAAAAVGGTQSRYTSMVAKECWGSGLSVLRAASGESRVAEAPYGAYLQVAISAEREDRVPRMVLLTARCQHRHGERVRAGPTGGHRHGHRRWILRHRAVRGGRWPCPDELYRQDGWEGHDVSVAQLAWHPRRAASGPGIGGQGVSSVGRGVPMTVICALRVKMDAAPRRC